jgi:hypothetical protein
VIIAIAVGGGVLVVLLVLAVLYVLSRRPHTVHVYAAENPLFFSTFADTPSRSTPTTHIQLNFDESRSMESES